MRKCIIYISQSGQFQTQEQIEKESEAGVSEQSKYFELDPSVPLPPTNEKEERRGKFIGAI